MDWLKGKSKPETIAFLHEIGGCPIIFPSNQSIDDQVDSYGDWKVIDDHRIYITTISEYYHS